MMLYVIMISNNDATCYYDFETGASQAFLCLKKNPGASQELLCLP